MTVVYQIAVDQMEAPVAVPTDKEKNVALAMKDSYVVAIDQCKREICRAILAGKPEKIFRGLPFTSRVLFNLRDH